MDTYLVVVVIIIAIIVIITIIIVILNDFFKVKNNSDNISRVFCFYTGKKPVQKKNLFLRYVYTDQKIKSTTGHFGGIIIIDDS